MHGADAADVNSRAPQPSEDEKLARLIDKIVHSATFSSSEILRKLLEYLGSRTVENSASPIKSKEIAAAVFGRVSNFDPQTDSIVRVHAGRLRSKLAEYYLSEGAEDEWIVVIPKGSYELTLHDRNGNALRHTRNAAEAAKQTSDAVPQAASAARRRLVFGLAYAAGLVAVAVVSWLLASSATRARLADITPALKTFWQDFLSNDERALIVYCNVRVRATNSDRLFLFPSNGEVLGVFQIARFFASVHKEAVAKNPRMVTWDEAKDADLVFVGSPLAETPLRSVPTFHDFAFRSGGPNEEAFIENLRPRKGEPTIFRGAPTPKTYDYAVVALTKPFSPKHSAVTVAGLAGYGTDGASEFVTHEDRVQQLLSMLAVKPGGNMPSFEAVLRFNVQGETPMQPEIVVVHRLN